MKTQIVPFGTNSGGFNTGYDLYNHSNETQVVSVHLQSYDGKKVKTLRKSIDAKGHYLITAKEVADTVNDRHTLIVEGPDELMITPILTFSNKLGVAGFGSLPVYDTSKLKN